MKHLYIVIQFITMTPLQKLLRCFDEFPACCFIICLIFTLIPNDRGLFFKISVVVSVITDTH